MDFSEFYNNTRKAIIKLEKYKGNYAFLYFYVRKKLFCTSLQNSHFGAASASHEVLCYKSKSIRTEVS